MKDCTKKGKQRSNSQHGIDPRHIFEYHWFAFYQGWLEGRNLKDHHLRDGAAFRELSVPLDDRGGRYVRLLRNGPATPQKLKHWARIIRKLVDDNRRPLVEDIVEYDPGDVDFLGPGQLLVAPTRIPMNDFQQEDKVQVQPGFTALEQTIIRACRPYLPVCARSRVRMAEALAARLAPDYADRADIGFRMVKEPWYSLLCTASPEAKRRRPKGRRCRTAAYLLQLPEVPGLNGADLLVMWGQGGTQTLAFAQLLRTDLSYLLDQYGFSMVELVGPETAGTPEGEAPESEPFRLLDSLLGWEVHVLLQGVLLDRGGQRVLDPKPVRRGRAPLPRERRSTMKAEGPQPSGVRQTGSHD
jgi:hypothetical protein